MGTLRKFLALPAPDRTLVLQALVAVVNSSIVVHLFPSSYVTSSLRRKQWTLGTSPRYSVEQIVWSVAAVSNRVPGSSCLVRAIALSRLMFANGHECRIDIGVKKSPEGKLAAHAWVQHEGQVILGGEAEEFKVIASFPRVR